MTPSLEVLVEIVMRLREDLGAHVAETERALEQQRKLQTVDHELLLTLRATRERRKELSAARAVLVAALVAGLFQTVVALISKFG